MTINTTTKNLGGILHHPDAAVRLAPEKNYVKTRDYKQDEADRPPLTEQEKALKVLLLEPVVPSKVYWGRTSAVRGYLPPLGLISIYSFLKYTGYDVEFVDTQFDEITDEQVTAYLKKGNYDVVGIPVFTASADSAIHTAKLIKSVLPNCKTVFGGVHASSQPELTLAQCPELDFVVKLEGEFTFDELLRRIASGSEEYDDIAGIVFRKGNQFIDTPNRPFIADLDTLPVGMFSDLDLERYVPHPTQYIKLPNYPVVTQRGCPYPCSYCEASVILGKKVRLFSPDRVIEELKILKHEKGAKGIYFQDSTFTINKKYAMELMEKITKADLGLLWSCNTRTDRIDDEILAAMRTAGCRQIFLGIESGNQESLDLVRKQVKVEVQTEGVAMIKRHKMAPVCNYMLCLPGETPEMARNTITYAKNLAAPISLFYLPVPFPGSHLFKSCVEDGGMREVDNWADFRTLDLDEPIYINPKIGKEGMKEIYRSAYRSYYSDPRVWAANFQSLMWGAASVSAGLRGLRAIFSLSTKKTAPARDAMADA
ncbi:MAG: B12-binding domain-containing radical SAM protein [Alphaproteobacteria bacterium]|nr:B12-binding domain-containing radical SAM protein [Rhodospirillales bacterium]MCW9045110.1 B12-binding domain-containing radical SAM protein [Alphaproteobacteria bacterium]